MPELISRTEIRATLLLALAVIYGMVVLGFNKRRLVWRTKCRVCGGPAGLCSCHLPRF